MSVGSITKGSSLVERWRRWSLNPIYYATISLLVIVAGGIASLFADDIKTSFPFVWHGPWSGFSLPASGFWLLATAATMMVWARQYFVDDARARAQEELRRETDNLKQAIRTMPPATFLQTYARMVALADRTISTALANLGTKEAKDKSIRLLLRSIALLARSFDGDVPDSRYAANIMMFHPTNGKPSTELQQDLVFCEDGVRVEGLPGVLVLNPEWSSTTEAEDDKADPAITKRMVLPVPPNLESVDKKIKALPGAPYSFSTREFASVPDTSRLGDWFQARADISQSVQREMERYFHGQRQQIRSFISVPLRLPVQQDAAAEPIGVLNIHSNMAGLLRTEAIAIASFQYLLTPYLIAFMKILAPMSDA